jgi:hypothetical protein
MKSGKEMGLLSARRRTRAATVLTSDFVAIGAEAGSFIVTGFGKVLALETTDHSGGGGGFPSPRSPARKAEVETALGKCQI